MTEPLRRWLITGVSSGLGRALAEHVLDRGDIVLGTVRNPGHASEFEDIAPGRAVSLHLDMSDVVALDTRVPAAIEKSGGVDVLVNNAGHSLLGAVEETSIDEAREMMATNFLGPMRLVQLVLPHLRRQGNGWIVNIASVAATVALPWSAMYSASKSALAAWSDALAEEVGDLGIRVTCVEPGGLSTNFTGSSLRTVGTSLDAYAEQMAQIKQRYAGAAAKPRTNPADAAAAIASIARTDQPPRRLALGSDAYTSIVDALTRRMDEYGRQHRTGSG